MSTQIKIVGREKIAYCSEKFASVEIMCICVTTAFAQTYEVTLNTSINNLAKLCPLVFPLMYKTLE